MKRSLFLAFIALLGSPLFADGVVNDFRDSEGNPLGTSLNITFLQSGANVTYLRIPKNATVVNATVNVSGYSGFDQWINDDSIVDGLGDVGDYSNPTIAYNLRGDGKWVLISGDILYDALYGFYWNETQWIKDDSIVSGLGYKPSGYSAPTFGYNVTRDNKWITIIGNGVGTFNGYYWNSSGWTENTSLVSGLGDIGDRSSPTLAYNATGDNNWILIAGEYDGTFNGFYWNGTQWINDASIVNGLGSVGGYSDPSLVYDLRGDGRWALISGDGYGTFTGYYWNGSGWTEDSSLVAGLGDIGARSTPAIAYNLRQNVWTLISGDVVGTFHSFYAYSFPTNLSIDVGNDSIEDWSIAELNSSNSPQLVELNMPALQDYVDINDANAGYVLVPLNISSATPGVVELSDLAVSYETRLPEIAFTQVPENASTLDEDWVFLNLTIGEYQQGSTALLEWNGVNHTMQEQGNCFYLNMTSLQDGEYVFRVYANNTEGKLNTSEPFLITVDADASATFASPSPGNGSIIPRNWVFVNISTDRNHSEIILEWGNSSGYTNVSMTIVNASSSTYAYKNMTGLDDGTYNFTVYVKGNESEGRFIEIDTTPPDIVIDIKEITNGTPELSISTSEPSKMTYSWDGEGDIPGCTSCTSFITSYGEVPPASDTSLLLHFNENSSLVGDDSGKGHNISFGSPTPEGVYDPCEPQWVEGRYGRALEFDGIDDYLEINNSEHLNFTSPFTVLAWVKPRSDIMASSIFNIIEKEGDYGLRVSWDALPRFFVDTPNCVGFCDVSGNVSFVPEIWQCVGGKYEASTVRVYLNGILVGSDSAPGFLLSSEYSMIIGGDVPPPSDPGLPNPFPGAIDEVAIFNRALSDDEIQGFCSRGMESGDHSVTVFAIDGVGNLNSTTAYFTVDATPPFLDLGTANDSKFSTQSVTLAWTAGDSLPNITSDLFIDGQINKSGIATNNATPTRYTVSGLGEGRHNWSVVALDGVGNVNASPTYSFTIDLTEPILGNASVEVKGERVTIVIDAYDALAGVESVEVEVLSSGGNSYYSMVYRDGVYKLERSFPEGEYLITNFYVYDLAGNLKVMSSNLTFKVASKSGPFKGGGGGGGGGSPSSSIKEGFNILTPQLMHEILGELHLLGKKFYSIAKPLASILAIAGDSNGGYPAPETEMELSMQVEPLQGDVYEICVQEALAKWTSADTLLIARGDVGADSLAAAGYAKAMKAPILLTDPKELPPATLEALEILNPEEIIIVGGTDAISEKIGEDLVELARVRRIAGKNREDTAVKLAEALENLTAFDTIVITNGENASPEVAIIASGYTAPVLYVYSEEIPKVTQDYLAKFANKRMKVVLVGLGSYSIHHGLFVEFPELVR